MPTIHPHVMFNTPKAEAAIALYTSLFDDAEVLSKVADGGKVMHALIRVAGQTIALADSPVVHGFDLTPSLSLFVTCDDEAQLERLFAALSDGGEVRMPLGAYGFSTRFGWTDDRFGVSWQLNLP